MKYPVLQQPLIQPPVHPQIDSLGGGSGCHVMNGISDGRNFCHMQINSVNRIAADTLTPSPAGGVKSDIAMNHVSVASGDHFQFPSDLSYTSALELKYLFQGLGSKWSLPDDQTGNHFEFHNNASQVPSTSCLSDLAAVFSNVGDNAESGNYTQCPFLQAGPDVPLMPLHLSDNTELGNYTQSPFLQAGPDVPLMPLHLLDNTELGNYTQSPFLQAGPDVPLNSEVHTDVDTFTFNSNPVPATYLREKR